MGPVGRPEGIVDVQVGELRERVARAPGRFSSRPARSGCSRASARRPARARPPAPRPPARRRPGAIRTSAPISSPSRSATGASERSGSGPSGRPRCETRISSAPRSRRSSIVGSAARIRDVVGDPAIGERHVEVDPHEHAAPLDLRVADARLREAQPPRGREADGRDQPSAPREPARLEHLGGELDTAVRVAPLVVVPGDHLDHAAVAITIVCPESKIDECGSLTMSVETIGSSV